MSVYLVGMSLSADAGLWLSVCGVCALSWWWVQMGALICGWIAGFLHGVCGWCVLRASVCFVDKYVC